LKKDIEIVKSLGAMIDYQTNFVAKLDKEREKMFEEDE
jgi:hypothetical protein